MTGITDPNANTADGKQMLTVAALEATLKKHHDELKEVATKASSEAKDAGSIAAETKSALDSLAEQATQIADRLHELEQRGETNLDDAAVKTIGEQFVESENFKRMLDGDTERAKFDLKMNLDEALSQKAIINATGQNQPLVPAQRLPGIIAEPNRVLRIRDVMNVGPTSSNLIEYPKELLFTNNAGPQAGGSPLQFENVQKPESNITFELDTAAVITLAHWIPASKQVLADSPALQSYINSRLMYGLKLEEEDQLLNGDGTSGNLSGLLNTGNFTPYAPQSPDVVATNIDLVRDAIRQANTAEYVPNAVIMNPVDWANLEMLKVNAGTDDRYILGDPASRVAPRIWGLPVVASNSIGVGTFLLGSFDMAAQIWDRMAMTIAVSTEDRDNFVKNMVTLLAEERLALAIYRPAALVSGTFA